MARSMPGSASIGGEIFLSPTVKLSWLLCINFPFLADLEDENDLTLTNIASGQMLSNISGDFYNESDGMDILVLEQFVHADTGPAFADINIRRFVQGSHGIERERNMKLFALQRSV